MSMSPIRATTTSVLAAVLVVHAAAASVAAAADEPRPPSASRGVAVAERLCAGCHLTGAGSGVTVQAGLPSFAAIANRPGQTAGHLRNVLIRPHAPMPDLQLTNEEIADIITWLDTLRDPKNSPLLPRDEGGKPAYPEPT